MVCLPVSLWNCSSGMVGPGSAYRCLSGTVLAAGGTVFCLPVSLWNCSSGVVGLWSAYRCLSGTVLAAWWDCGLPTGVSLELF